MNTITRAKYIEELIIAHLAIDWSVIEPLITNPLKLKNLETEICCENYDKSLEFIFKNFINLERLCLFRIARFTGRRLQNLLHLERLILTWDRPSWEKVWKISSSCPKVKHLKLIGKEPLMDEDYSTEINFQNLPRLYPQLETFSYSSNEDRITNKHIQIYAEMRNLKEITLWGIKLVRDINIEPLIDLCPHLTKLHIRLPTISPSLQQKIVQKAENYPTLHFKYYFKTRYIRYSPYTFIHPYTPYTSYSPSTNPTID